MSLTTLLIQLAISLLVVALYHLWVSRKSRPAPAPPVVPPPVAQPDVSVAAEAMPPELLAVIAAAITVVLDQPPGVFSVQQAAAPAPEVNVWALEGRMKQFMSHKVR
jgi:hypothetical protein